jgi:hypothetical protein
MAEPNTPIPFTVGDQERLVSIESKLASFCAAFDPALAERVESLEGSRRRWSTFFITILSGSTVAAVGCWIRKMINGG